MPRYIYFARRADGRKEKGTEDARNEEDLINRLQARGLVISSIKPEEPAKVARQIEGKQKFSRRRITIDDRVLFSRQLSTLLESGLTILKSLEVISQQVASRGLFTVLNQLKRDVERGLSLSEAVAKHPKVFSQLWLGMVKTGEASGNLPSSLEHLARYLEAKAGFRRKIISALIYPIILFCVAIGAIVVFVTVVVPKFAEIFAGFGGQMPLPTQILINFSLLAKRGAIPGIIILIFLFFMLRTYLQSESGRMFFDRLMLGLPVFGKIYRAVVIERFASELAMLVDSGVPILFSLEIIERSIGNKVLESIMKKIKSDVRDGKVIARPIMESGFFPPMVTQMISVGEETGELGKMIKKLAAYYEEYVATFITRFATLFEPMMLVFMGIIIGSMLVSMFLPVFQLATLAGGETGGF